MPHHKCDTKVVVLAYLSMAYLCASLLYILLTMCGNVGTPFKDSLSEQQKQIEKEAKHVRGNIFLCSLIVSSVLLYATRPLHL